MFISHTGEVSPSGFLPMVCGNVKETHPAEIYRHHPLFVSLRDNDALGGKCGICEFRKVCGGSRSRAYGVYGDPFAEDPACVYHSKKSTTTHPPSHHDQSHQTLDRRRPTRRLAALRPRFRPSRQPRQLWQRCSCMPAAARARKPITVWNITRTCNLRCVHCYSDSNAMQYPGELTWEQMKKRRR
jgi:radical SAM protein with 4Fe4S-binding SPASM domain